MYLSKLEIIGFKSFASKIRLDFTDGMSCIIGPNGSGKSNIVDAIRWVLGEQRVSSLRSDRMENVLFNGTRLRKPIGMAEVAMTIQNNKKILKTEFDEVVISRRLYRSGESQYLINKSPVRLKDILDLFVDTGMGANSYSVIELKMVESILSENTIERRQLFEEAAGIVKYKIRRKSAIRKLDATHSDLERINDIISEVDKTVGSLSRQVGKARRYLSYTEQLQKTEIDLYRFRYNRLVEAIRPLELQLKEASTIKEKSHHQITIDEALLEDYKRELIKTDHAYQEIAKKIHEIDTRVAQIKQDQAVAETKSEEMDKTRERYKHEIDDFGNKTKLLDDHLKLFQQELEELELQREEFEARYQEIESRRRQEAEILREKKEHIEKINNEYRRNMQSFSKEKEELKQKEYQLEFYNEQLNALGENIRSSSSTIAYLESQMKEVEKSKIELQKNHDKEIAILEGIQSEIKKLEEKKAQLSNGRNHLLAEIERVKSRQNFFEQIIAHYEGHSKSTQFAMSNRDNIPGVYGPLADIISIDDQYAWIVETILGDALNYILVEDIKVAKNLISLIKENKKGRITLIPLSQIGENVQAKFNINGSIKLLPELIACEERYSSLINILLGDVALVETLDDALQESRTYPNLRFVTLNGEMVNFNREVSGGSVEKKDATIIGRKDQLKQIKQQLTTLHLDLSDSDKQIENISAKINNAIGEKTTSEKRIEDLRNIQIDLDKKDSQLKYEIAKQQEGQKDEEGRVSKYNDNISMLKQEIQNLNTVVQNNQLSVNEKEKETIKLTNEYEKFSQSVQLLLEEVQKEQINVTNIQNKISNRENDIVRTTNSIRELTDNIESRKEEIQQITDFLNQIGVDSEKRQVEQESIWEKRDALETDANVIEQKGNEIKAKIIDIEEQTRKYRKEHDNSLEKSRALELKINENRLKSENLREYIIKEYSEDIEIGIPFEDFNESEAEDSIDSLRNRIKSLGPVNPLAVSEYEKEKERLDFLTNQRDDLEKAEKSLKETIKKINKTARKQFLDTFEEIKKNFEHVFRSFFENGEGTLQLEESEDPLEADIEINVRTKGKKLQTLTLLSGGEKTLTAISLLFSIYLVKPSPFCILDEVDAPLDDMNIGRFTDALKAFSKNTQFIVVTHNKRTMEAAQTMYGVTMEEEGISKIVSVKFT